METKDFAKGALVGAMAGAIGGALFAPKAGQETREDLMKSFGEIKDNVMKKLENAEDFSKDMYDKIVKEAVTSYETAKKITPEDSEKINQIFEKSFTDIESILKKDVEKIAKPSAGAKK